MNPADLIEIIANLIVTRCYTDSADICSWNAGAGINLCGIGSVELIERNMTSDHVIGKYTIRPISVSNVKADESCTTGRSLPQRIGREAAPGGLRKIDSGIDGFFAAYHQEKREQGQHAAEIAFHNSWFR
jgi:hypothetical protein